MLTLVFCLLGVSSYGTHLLRTDSDLTWFLPTDSYLTKFLRKYESSFDEGLIADLYIGMCRQLTSRSGYSHQGTLYIERLTVNFWLPLARQTY